MTATTEHATGFGPLAEPLHPDAATSADPDYKDNAYFGFWTHVGTAPVFGEVHMSTSPNGLRRARIAVTVDDHIIEIDEDCPKGTYTSEHISFDVAGALSVDHPDLKVEMTYTPRYQPMNYSPKKLMGATGDHEPIRHYEMGVGVSGTITARGETIQVDGLGFRDRSWGFRDESKLWREYLTVWGTFEGFDIAAMKFELMDGVTVTDGFLNTDEGQRRVTEMNITYDPAGTFHTLRFLLDGTEERIITRRQYLGGYWLPMGPQKEEGAPCFHAFDEFAEFDAWGHIGRGIVGYGIQRNIK